MADDDEPGKMLGSKKILGFFGANFGKNILGLKKSWEKCWANFGFLEFFEDWAVCFEKIPAVFNDFVGVLTC